ncbi:MAG TPA: hypothetical protein VGY53_02685 [Isosphaeraceae bacterium]|jgi:hypothetical protein|nr:hypothetical protein [Isosphaeraceae bacterium]
MTVPWVSIVVLAGVSQLGIVAGSLAIPRVLRWRDDLARLRPLTRQIFWTYAAYIWCTNLAFGLVSTFAPKWLLDGTPLAGAVCGFIALYWGARVVIQFAYFDRNDAPKGPLFALAEAILVGLFLFLTLVFGALAVQHFGGFGP